MLNAQQDVRAAGQEEVVAFLSRSETFGGQAVEIVETHASIIFLAGDRAFKLKRAVRYSFLDYSTPERRRDACLAELSINRRFAPDLYLEVQPVVRRPDGLLGFGNGASVPVDWLVVMRRFDAAAQLDRMAEKGELRPELARPLAERIADLHARAEARFNQAPPPGSRGRSTSRPATCKAMLRRSGPMRSGGGRAAPGRLCGRTLRCWIGGSAARGRQGARLPWRPAPSEHLPAR